MDHKNTGRWVKIVAVAMVLATAGAAKAQTTYFWLNPGTDGEVYNPANWTPSALPGAGDSLVIGAAGTLTVTVDLSNSAGTSFAGLDVINTDMLTLDLDGHDLHVDDLHLEENEVGQSTVVTLRNSAGPTGFLILDSVYADSVVVDNATLQVGDGVGLGSALSIGGPTGAGHLEVGIGSTYAYAGSSVVRIGDDAAAAGSTVTVSDGGLLYGTTLFVGDDAEATLTLQNRAPTTFESYFDVAFVGSSGPSVMGTLNIDNADLIINEQLNVVHGSVNLTNGATLDVGQSATFSTALIDGTITGAVPDVQFSVDASTLNVTGDVRFGLSTTEFHVSNASDIDIAGDLMLSPNNGATTTHTIGASDIDVTGDLELEAIGLDTDTTLEVLNGATVDAANLYVKTSGANNGRAEAIFDGAGTTGTFQQVVVQGDGSQRLEVTGGAMVEATQVGDYGVLIGDGPMVGASVFVSGAGSALNVTGVATGTKIHAADADTPIFFQVVDGATASLGVVEQYRGSVQVFFGSEIDFESYYFGAGDLYALGAGATLTGISLQVGDDPNATVAGETATLLATEGAVIDLNVSFIVGGRRNDGVANLQSGSTLDALHTRIGNWRPDDGFVSYPQSGDGTVTLSGDGTALNIQNSLTIGSDAGVPVQGTLTVNSQTSVTVGGDFTIEDTGTVNLLGGTITAPDVDVSGGAFDWSFGTLNLSGDVDLLPTKIAALLASSGGTLGTARTLSVDGEATLYQPLVIDGGTFEYGSLVNGQFLQVNGGSVAATSHLFVTLGGDLGRVVNVEDYALDVNNNLYVEQDGILQVRGIGEVFVGTLLDVRGRLEMYDGTSYINANGIEVSGILSGSGYVLGHGSGFGGDLYTTTDGEVRVTDGQHLFIDTAGISNDGTFYADDAVIELFAQNGGDFEFENQNPFDDEESGESGPGGHIILLNDAEFIMHEGELTNYGQVSVEDAILRVPEFSTYTGGVATFSGEETKVFGGVYVDPGGDFTISSGTRAKFFDEAEIEGEVFVGEDGLAIFLDGLGGSPTFLGDGGAEIHGTFSPGSSPGAASFQGDLDLSNLDELLMEIAGLQQGVDYDFIDVEGTLTAGGTLNIELLNGWTPNLGDSYNLLDFGTLDGQFVDIILPNLPGFLQWDTSEVLTTGSLEVVPEPTTLALLGLATLTSLTLIRRRRLR